MWNEGYTYVIKVLPIIAILRVIRQHSEEWQLKDYPCDKVLYEVVIYVVRHISGQKAPECDQCDKKNRGR